MPEAEFGNLVMKARLMAVLWVALGIGCSSSTSPSSPDAARADCGSPVPSSSTETGDGGCSYERRYVCVRGEWQPTRTACTDTSVLPYTRLCGNGLLNEGEACDDRNESDGDGCNRLCELETDWSCPTPGRPCLSLRGCGNGQVTTDEVCDDGNTAGGDGCAADCQAIEPGWQCRVPGRACVPVCPDGIRIAPRCGTTCMPWVVDAGETCDGGAALAVCGDGVVAGDEECDDGDDPRGGSHNQDDLYGGCTTACKLGPYCGDGLVNGGEECDLGVRNGLGSSSCTSACRTAHYCGDGKLDVALGEQCDLGRDNGGDRQPCDLDCEIHPLDL